MDTRDKRSSALLHSLPWRGFFPTPDGALDQGDRQHTCLMYRGIEAIEPETGTGVPALMCEPVVWKLSLVPLALDVEVVSFSLPASESFVLNTTMLSLALDVAVEPMSLRCA